MKIIKLQVVKAATEEDSSEWNYSSEKKVKSEEDVLANLYDNPQEILKIKEPTEEQKQIALTEMPELIKELKHPEDDDYLTAVRTDGLVLEFIENRTKRIIEEALKQNGDAIQFLDDPTSEQINWAILSSPFCIKFLKAPTKENFILAIRQDGLAIQFIKNPSESLQLLAVKKHPSALSIIKDPPRKVQIEAVSQNGLVIEFIENPDEQLQLLAIDKSEKGFAYRYIDNPTPAADDAAFRKNKALLPYLKTVPAKIQLELVTSDISNFKYIKVPTKECQNLALKSIVANPHIFDDVTNIDKDVLEAFLQEIKFKEKSDKRLQLPEGLNLAQLQLYHHFQKCSKKEMLKTDFRGLPWLDKRIKTIINSVKGANVKLSDIIDYKIEKPDTEIGIFIQKRFGLAKLPNKKEIEILDVPSNYFVVYADAIKLLDLEFNKDHIVNMSKALADRQQPYLPNQYILGYVRYSVLKQNVWLDNFWIDQKLESAEDELKWLPEWVMALFIREMRYRDYSKFYTADLPLRKRLYKDEVNIEPLLERAYFKPTLIKGFHPLVNGKEVWTLS